MPWQVWPAARRPACRRRAGSANGAPPDRVPGAGSCPRLLAEQAAADPAGADIDAEDDDDDHHQDGADVRIIELADRNHELLPYAAGADKAHHGGFAHVDLEPEQCVARVTRDHLRQYGEPHAGEPTRAGRAHTLDRFHVDIFNVLGKLLATRTGG